ncbi:MAG: radical SAM protein, partial [Candidatus Zixiibacteriota bacterium]
MLKGLKTSRYNISFQHPDGANLIFNAMTGAMVQVGKDSVAAAERLLYDPRQFVVETDADRALMDAVKQARILIDGDIDEMKLLRLRANAMKFGTDHFYLSVRPTEDCNLACTYCRETLTKGKMSPENQEALAKWVAGKVSGLKGMTVAWTGPEPLMAFDVIGNLTTEFRKACGDHKTEYNALLTTNGYFMIPRVIDKFRDLRINAIHITLDGPPETHNRQRPLKNGKGNFDRILDNLIHLSETLEEIKIVICVNCDESAVSSVPDLFPLIPEVVRKKSWVFFGSTPVDCCGESRDTFIEPELAGEKERRSDLMELCRIAASYGFRIFLPRYAPLDNHRNKGHFNRYAVDMNCGLSKCLVPFDNMRQIGRIFQDGIVEINMPVLTEWVVPDPLDHEICKDCKILPLCLDSCIRCKSLDEA